MSMNVSAIDFNRRTKSPGGALMRVPAAPPAQPLFDLRACSRREPLHVTVEQHVKHRVGWSADALAHGPDPRRHGPWDPDLQLRFCTPNHSRLPTGFVPV